MYSEPFFNSSSEFNVDRKRAQTAIGEVKRIVLARQDQRALFRTR
jgi:hypothetical protein